MAEYVDKAVVVDMLRTKAELGRASGYGTCYDNAAKMVELLPAADVAPVRHGFWIPYGFCLCKCSECGQEGVANKYNYCLNCGAKMDKEREEE